MNLSFQSIAPYLGAVGNELINLDENITGGDDFAGNVLVYVAEVGQAIQSGQDIPEIPEIIRKGTSEKISGPVRATLRLASSVLTVAQFTVSGKAATVLKYLNQVLRALLAGRPVPEAPDSLIKEVSRTKDDGERLDRAFSMLDELSNSDKHHETKRQGIESRLASIEDTLAHLQTIISRLPASQSE